MRTLAVALALTLTLTAASAQAGIGDYYTEPRPYYVKIFAKLGRGLSNVLFGWTELYGQTYKEGLHASIHGQTVSDTAIGAGAGFAVGIGYTVLRMGLGTFDTVSFFVPTRPLLLDPATPAKFLEDVPTLPHGAVTLPDSHR